MQTNTSFLREGFVHFGRINEIKAFRHDTLGWLYRSVFLLMIFFSAVLAPLESYASSGMGGMVNFGVDMAIYVYVGYTAVLTGGLGPVISLRRNTKNKMKQALNTIVAWIIFSFLISSYIFVFMRDPWDEENLVLFAVSSLLSLMGAHVGSLISGCMAQSRYPMTASFLLGGFISGSIYYGLGITAFILVFLL